MEKLNIKNLTFSYPFGNFSLEDINLSIEEGDFVLLIGKSGSGKSTLLKLIKPLARPYGKCSGKIFYDGKEKDSLSEYDKSFKIGFVGQNPDTEIITDTVKSEIEFSLSNMGVSSDEMSARCAEIATFFGIGDWYDKKTDYLSGGEKQILNLASVMVTKPEILVLDEPTSRQDPISAEKFINLLLKINSELGTTIIISEHKTDNLFEIADKILVMEKGRVLTFGKKDAVSKFLYEENNSLVKTLPASVKVFLNLSNEGKVPENINEGRVFLKSFKQENEIKNQIKISKENEKKENVITLKDVFFSYRDGEDIIKNLSLNVKHKEILSILGKNGAGKSTILKLIAGLMKTDEGKILIKGKKPEKIEDFYEKVIAFVPQNPENLFSEKTVYDEFYKACGNFESLHEKRNERIKKISKLLGISGKLTSHPLDLSGGEIEKAAIALALLKDPEIILLDEPTKGLDADFKTSLSKVFKSLKNEGKTIIIVSHDTEFCAKISDRCALLFSGKIMSVAPAKEFFLKNSFYTTKAKLLTEGILENVVLEEDILYIFGKNTPEKKDSKEQKSDDIILPKEKEKKLNKKRLFFGLTFLGLSVVSQFFLSFSITVILLILGIFLLSQGDEIPVLEREDNSFLKKDIISVILIFILLPLTFILGNENYYIISVLMILEVFFVFVSRFERKKKKTNEIAIIAILSAVAVASRIAFCMLPQIKPITAIVIISGLSLGCESGFLIGLISAFSSNFFFGQGPWTIYQMMGLGIVGFMSGIVFKTKFIKRTRLTVAVFGFLATLVFYGVIQNVSTIFLTQKSPTLKMLYTTLIAGLPFDLVNSSSTAFFLWFLAGDMIKTLERIKKKYGFFKTKF